MFLVSLKNTRSRNRLRQILCFFDLNLQSQMHGFFAANFAPEATSSLQSLRTSNLTHRCTIPC